MGMQSELKFVNSDTHSKIIFLATESCLNWFALHWMADAGFFTDPRLQLSKFQLSEHFS